jgi:tRNA U38,U39,U40 pseudouridine synthase TruA
VGDGRRDPAGAADVLSSQDRSKVGDIAPPHGLVLESVRYPGIARNRPKLTGSAGDR